MIIEDNRERRNMANQGNLAASVSGGTTDEDIDRANQPKNGRRL